MTRRTLGDYSPVAVLVGAIMGVGMFGLPYIGIRAGFIPMIGFLCITVALLYLLSHAYSEVIIGTSGKHRFPGYVEKYLGHNWKQAAFFTTTIGMWGALLSYIILGGRFLTDIFNPLVGGSLLFYSLLFFFVGAYFIFRDAQTVARIELILLWLFPGIIVILGIIGFSKIHLSESVLLNPGAAILPYGLVLFSLWGINMLPDISEMVDKNRKRLERVSLKALLMSAILYLIFIILVIGISGKNTSTDALSGLRAALGEKVLILGFLFGIIATFTSFIALGLNLKKVFMYDYEMHPMPSLFMALGIPLVLFLTGITNYLGIISVTGGVVLGFEGILILILYERFAKDRQIIQIKKRFSLVSFTKPLMVILGAGVILGLLAPFILERL